MEAKLRSPLGMLRMPQEKIDTTDQLARTELVSHSDVIRTFVRERIAEREANRFPLAACGDRGQEAAA